MARNETIPRLLDGREDEVLELYNAGSTAAQIAERFKCSPSTIMRLVSQREHVHRRGRKSSVAELHEQLRALHDQGLDVMEIGTRLGISYVSVWRHLTRMGISLKKAVLEERDLPRMQEMYAAGSSIQEIAKLMGVTYAPLYRFFKKHGLDTRKPGAHSKGSQNPRWMGPAVGYGAAHDRVRKLRGTPSHCEMCGTHDPRKKYDWASKTENYADPNDYMRLCKSCHRKRDYQLRVERFGLTNSRQRWDLRVALEKGEEKPIADLTLEEARDWIARFVSSRQPDQKYEG